MRLSICLSVLFAGLVCLQFCRGTCLDAQELRQTLRDYRTDRPFYYQPSDPFTRSRVFNAQTGNYGRYYNCDGEERKRYSPYICWKPHTEPDVPPRVGLMEQAKRDLAEVRQRVKDGAGACYKTNCNCGKCRKANQPRAIRIAEGDPATNNRPESSQTTQLVSKDVAPTSNRATAKFGLLAGKIIQPKSVDKLESIQPPVRSASKSRTLMTELMRNR